MMVVFAAFNSSVKWSGIVNLSYIGVEIFIEFREDFECKNHLHCNVVRTKKAWVLSFPLSAQRGVWSDWADAQADLSLRWAHSHFVGFVMSRLIFHHIFTAAGVKCYVAALKVFPYFIIAAYYIIWYFGINQPILNCFQY